MTFYLVSLLLMQDSNVTFLDSQGSSLVFLSCMLWSCAQFWEWCLDLTGITSLSPSSSTLFLCSCLPLSERFLPQLMLFFFFLNYMRTEWSLRGKGNCCSCLQPRNSKSCKFSCTASTQTNWMHSSRPWQGKSLKETLPGCSSSPIAAVICAVCFLAMRAARKVLVFSCCFVFLRPRFSCGQDFALLRWWVWGSPL